ncbi:MAG: helix-turn-helix transcriptional regulator [Pseudomonadota bacterium]|nr:helix-turn-helix transcriptional regulator [Pseudomonadota bacterium]
MDITSPPATFIERLAALAQRTRLGTACFHARHAHGIKSLQVEQPSLAVVLRGSKQVRAAQCQALLAPGDMLVLAPGARLDVAHRPGPGGAGYLALGLPLCAQVLSAARSLWPQPLQPGAAVACLPGHVLQADLHALAQAMHSGDELQARMAVLALLMQAARHGTASVLLPPAPSLAAQLRQLVAQAPARAWQSMDFEQALGISGATLRRRLAQEGTGLREEMAQARLACALDLLYTTRLPVKTVAARVGYRSAESFSRRFRQRYGLEPSAIGNGTDSNATEGHAPDSPARMNA